MAARLDADRNAKAEQIVPAASNSRTVPRIVKSPVQMTASGFSRAISCLNQSSAALSSAPKCAGRICGRGWAWGGD
jgi:hypothetical protein